jgi:hypothetical protein
MNLITKRLTLPGVAILGALALASAAYADSSGVSVGVLTCNEASGWGFVFGSSHKVNCTFSTAGGRTERYVGHINKFGVDIGYQKAGVLVWTVFAPTTDVSPSALAGHYGGATAEAAVAVGPAANVLIGGSNKAISLQPVSLGGAEGLNVAAGIAELSPDPQS